MFKIKIYRSEKSQKIVRCLIADLGYRVAVLSYDICLISELLKKPVSEIYELVPGLYNIPKSNI